MSLPFYYLQKEYPFFNAIAGFAIFYKFPSNQKKDQDKGDIQELKEVIGSDDEEGVGLLND